MPSRAWMKKDMYLKMPTSRGNSYTLIGGISDRGLIHYELVKGSNNGKIFAGFCRDLIKKVRGVASVYMDNATKHHSRAVKELFTDRIDQRFLPAYSCALNPIEKFWNVIKA